MGQVLDLNFITLLDSYNIKVGSWSIIFIFYSHQFVI